VRGDDTRAPQSFIEVDGEGILIFNIVLHRRCDDHQQDRMNLDAAMVEFGVTLFYIEPS